jgi:hypothetical protein
MKLRKEKQSTQDEIQKKLRQSLELKQALSFLFPELDESEILAQLVYQLTLMAEPELLTGALDVADEHAQNKLNEVSEMYEHFFSDSATDTDN